MRGQPPSCSCFSDHEAGGNNALLCHIAIKDVYRELQANGHVEILAMAGRISVRCVGQVNFEVNEEVKQWIYDNNPVLPRLYTSYDKLAYFALPIAAMDYYNLRPTPPILRHFDLVAGTEGSGFVGERFSKK